MRLIFSSWKLLGMLGIILVACKADGPAREGDEFKRLHDDQYVKIDAMRKAKEAPYIFVNAGIIDGNNRGQGTTVIINETGKAYCMFSDINRQYPATIPFTNEPTLIAFYVNTDSFRNKNLYTDLLTTTQRFSITETISPIQGWGLWVEQYDGTLRTWSDKTIGDDGFKSLLETLSKLPSKCWEFGDLQ